MAEIRSYLGIRHLRSEPTVHVLKYQGGKLKTSGRGVTFWFMPLSTSIAEIPVDTRDLPFLVHARSKDFQDVTVQGSIGYRITSPELTASVVDFSIDLRFGVYLKEPLEQIASFITGQCQQVAVGLLLQHELRVVLEDGLATLRDTLDTAVRSNAAISSMGIEIQEICVTAVRPTPELEKAFCTPTREHIQQQADEAMFQRRALAVEKERAIAENELQTQIELSRKEQTLIDQQGQNDRRRAEEKAVAEKIAVEAKADATRVGAEAQSERIRLVEGARVAAEKDRIDAYRNMAPSVLLGLAAQELAQKLTKIEHVSITPDMLAGGLSRILELAGSKGNGAKR